MVIKCYFIFTTPLSSTNKTDRHDITEILLKVALNTINQTNRNQDCYFIESGLDVQSNLTRKQGGSRGAHPARAPLKLEKI